MSRSRFVRFDGGMIGVGENRKAAVEWYTMHMGLKIGWDSPAEKMSWMQFPSGAAVTLKSFASEDHVREANVRLCFAAPDLTSTHARLHAAGVRVSFINEGPGGTRCFDFYDLEGTRLTAVEQILEPSLPEEVQQARVQFPDALFLFFSVPRFGVQDLKAATAWYAEHMGMTVIEDHSAAGAMLMVLNPSDPQDAPIWLEVLPADRFHGCENPTAQVYFLTLDIEAAHRHFVDSGATTSDIVGSGLRVFHTYDPNGNRINVWTYPGAE